MKSFGGLYSAIYSEANLRKALGDTLRGKTINREAKEFLEGSEKELSHLSDELREGIYSPGGYSQFKIKDPKPRIISCAPFRDRVAQHAICNVIGPIIERRFISDTYACRKGKGTHKAVLKAQKLAREYRYFCKIDVTRFFDNVDHDILQDVLARIFREKHLIDVLGRIIRCPYPMQLDGKGLPIGNLTSQWFANLYLDGADHMLTDEKAIPGYIRYMDDMLLFANSKQILWEYTTILIDWLASERKLTIKQKAFILSECRLGIPFLGCRVFPRIIRLKHSNYHRMLRIMKRKEKEYVKGEIDEEDMIATIRSTVANARYYGIRPMQENRSSMIS